MGGNNYDGDVAKRSRSTRQEVFTFRGYQGGDSNSASVSERRECHADLNIRGKIRECRETTEHPLVTPIVVAMDVTRSRGEDVKTVYGKLPMFIGQIIMNNYANHPELCWIAIGDASSGDQAPIQVGQFESDNKLDDQIAKIWLEEGGGGTGQESYELAAYVGANLMKLDANKRGKKGYFFFLGDEGFYPLVKRDQLKVWLGVDVPDDISSTEVFRALQEKFHVFFIYQKKPWENRKADIDAEIKSRVEKAGGMYENVAVRFTIIWGNTNDLDAHCTTPEGDHIYYSAKRACRHGGFLDVDMNIRGETMKPVENIRWEKGKAPAGRYQFWVETYAVHGFPAETEYRAELQVEDEIFHFEGKTPKDITGSRSKTIIHTLDYVPGQSVSTRDNYADYDEEVIKAQWRTVIPEEHILDLDDPKGVVDMMLGVLAVTGESSVDLDKYIEHMDKRDQSDSRQVQIRDSLSRLAGELVVANDSISNLALIHKKKKEKKSTRI